MVELIIVIATMAIVIMGWSKVSKALDWTGDRIGETTDMISDLTKSASKQTSRGVVISHDSLLDTVLESKEKDANRQKKETDFKAGLDKPALTALKKHEDWLAAIVAR